MNFEEYLNKVVTVWLTDSREINGVLDKVERTTLRISCTSIVESNEGAPPTSVTTVWQVPKASILAVGSNRA